MSAPRRVALCSFCLLLLAAWAGGRDVAQPQDQPADQAVAPFPFTFSTGGTPVIDPATGVPILDPVTGMPLLKAQLAGPAPRAPEPQTCDAVLTKRADRLLGRVVGIADGRVRLAGPQFAGEVKVLLSDVDQVTLAPGNVPDGRDAVALANGDVIAGEVTGITADTVMVASDAAGPLAIARAAVSAVSFGRPGGSLADCDFGRGAMGPWRIVSGKWQVQDGFLVGANGSGSQCMLGAPLDQAGPVTMEATWEPLEGLPVCLIMVMFSETTTDLLGVNSVYANVFNDLANVGWCRDRGSNTIGNDRRGPLPRGQNVMRFSFDPASKKARIWLNGNLAAEADVPQGPASGKQVMVGAPYGCRIKSVSVTGGAPAGPAVPPAGADADRVVFANGDQVSARSVALANGTLAVATDFGELNSPVAKVASVAFRVAVQPGPRPRTGEVLVQTRTGRLTLRLESLGDAGLVGASDCLGRVTVKRQAIRAIKFNVFQ